MNEDPKITVFWEKIYTDDTGKHIPDLFSKNSFDNISIKSYWGNTIDAFYKYDCLFMITAIEGDFRIVIAHDCQTEYKFTQYFISGLDGKIIKIPRNTIFGINNLNSSTGSIIMANIGSPDNAEIIKPDMFNWYSKR